MRVLVVSAILIALCSFGSVGCSSKAVEWDKNATVPFDKEKDGQLKALGPGAKKGKKVMTPGGPEAK
jgi:hypothetical protein